MKGGAVYATAPDASHTWQGQALFMPRISAGYKLDDKTVIKGGWGLFYDTLNAADYNTLNQLGYAVTTVNVPSTDFGQTWILGDPKNGVTPIVNPFPVRTTGTRFDSPLADTLGADASDGSNFTRENPTRQHARVQRWRVGVQRELFHSTAIEVAYSGAYADRVDLAIQGSYIPERSYSSVTNVRDASAQTLLQQQVPNPFFIGNFAALQASNPSLYARMAGNAFFTAPTTQRQNLIRAYPQLATVGTNQPLVLANLPLGIVKTHSLRGHGEPSLPARPEREHGLFGEPRAREPDRGALRSRADDVAIEPGGPAMEPARRSGLRTALRRRPRVPDKPAWPRRSSAAGSWVEPSRRSRASC